MARFMRKGKSRVYFAVTVASPTAPTVANVTGGTRLDTQLSEITGFEFQNNPIDVPDMSTAFVSKINGEDTVSDSSMSFYEDDTTNAILTALPKGTAGFVLIFYKGLAGANPAIGDVCEVWPVTVASAARKYTVANEAAMYGINFSNTSAPSAGTLV